MAEGTLGFFNAGLEALFTGGLNLSKTFRVALLSAGYTLNLAETSFSAGLSAYVCQNASGGPAIRKVGVGTLTNPMVGSLAWDLSDVNVTGTTGQIICAKYAILLQSAKDTPMAYCELSSGDAMAHIYRIQWPD